jgi:hypothetical protein
MQELVETASKVLAKRIETLDFAYDAVLDDIFARYGRYASWLPDDERLSLAKQLAGEIAQLEQEINALWALGENLELEPSAERNRQTCLGEALSRHYIKLRQLEELRRL